MFVNFETSRIMKITGYQDFIAEKDGMKNQIEKHCWHFSHPKYVCHLSTHTPPECLVKDKYDPYLPNHHELENLTLHQIQSLVIQYSQFSLPDYHTEKSARKLLKFAQNFPEEYAIKMGVFTRAVRDRKQRVSFRPMERRKLEASSSCSDS